MKTGGVELLEELAGSICHSGLNVEVNRPGQRLRVSLEGSVWFSVDVAWGGTVFMQCGLSSYEGEELVREEMSKRIDSFVKFGRFSYHNVQMSHRLGSRLEENSVNTIHEALMIIDKKHSKPRHAKNLGAESIAELSRLISEHIH